MLHVQCNLNMHQGKILAFAPLTEKNLTAEFGKTFVIIPDLCYFIPVVSTHARGLKFKAFYA